MGPTVAWWCRELNSQPHNPKSNFVNTELPLLDYWLSDYVGMASWIWTYDLKCYLTAVLCLNKVLPKCTFYQSTLKQKWFFLFFHQSWVIWFEHSVNSCQLITTNQIYLGNPEEPGYNEVTLQLYIYIKIHVWGMNTYLSYFLINSSLHVYNWPDVVKWQKVCINLRILTSIICEAYINHTSILYHSPISSEDLEKDLCWIINCSFLNTQEWPRSVFTPFPS